MSLNAHRIERGMTEILRGLGVDLTDRNYLETPERYARALIEMFEPDDIEWATFTEDYTDFILLKHHKLFSLCPHHMFPVKFYVSLAYVPNGKVLGLSKLARLLDECNNGPLLQEKFTRDVVKKLAEVCPDTQGAACLIQGRHGCMEMRGVRSEAELFTYRLSGVFEDTVLAERFFSLCR